MDREEAGIHALLGDERSLKSKQQSQIVVGYPLCCVAC